MTTIKNFLRTETCVISSVLALAFFMVALTIGGSIYDNPTPARDEVISATILCGFFLLSVVFCLLVAGEEYHTHNPQPTNE